MLDACAAPYLPPSYIIMLLDAASPTAVAAAAIIVIVTTVLLTYRKRLGFIFRAHKARRKLQNIIVEKQTVDDTDTSNNPYISAIFIHPIKSLRAVSLSETKFDQHGLLADRRLMIVRPLPTPIYGSFVDGEATHRL